MKINTEVNNSICLDKIKNTLRTVFNKENFDKMLITDEHAVKLSSYTLVKFKYQKVERKIKVIKFPLYSELKERFRAIKSSQTRFADKSQIDSNQIFDELKTNYLIKSKNFNGLYTYSNPFEYPLDVDNQEINNTQKKYFIPSLTNEHKCDECNGEKYIKCPDTKCGGKHEYTCPKCDGNLKSDCNNCSKTGCIRCLRCDGSGEYKCSKCKGKGEIKCGAIMGCGGRGYTKSAASDSPQKICRKCSGRGYSPCAECRNGIIKCGKCRTKGEIICDDCAGRGEIDCNYCNVSGKIICKTCYGDKDLYGTVDCPECKKTGIMVQMVYIESIVSDNETTNTIFGGETITIPGFDEIFSGIKKRYSNNPPYQMLYHKVKVNNSSFNDCDESNQRHASEFEKLLGLNKDSFPMITKEEISTQTIVCVQSSYKHLLTNITHNFLIVDFWNNPEVIFDKISENKIATKDTVKIIFDFLHKLFRTEKSKLLENKINEIILLIHFLKSGRCIKDSEKVLIRETVGDFSIFTNSTKKKLFQLIDSSTLPELTKEEFSFISSQRGQEVLNKLIEISKLDEEVETARIVFLEKFKNTVS